MGELKRFVDSWDAELTAWVEAVAAGVPARGNRHARVELRREWLGARPTEATGDDPWDATPEPYVGDVLGAPLAVVLCHNPSAAVAMQRPGGALFERLRAGERFSSLVGAWEVAGETRRWWRRYAEWAARLVGLSERPKLAQVAGFDLLPWHTRERVPLVPGPKISAYLREELLPGLSAAAARSKLRATLDGEERPSLLATHARVEQVLLAVGATPRITLDASSPEVGARWPRSFGGEPVQRRFALLTLPGLRTAVLCTDAPGSNLPPGRAFDPLVRELLAGGLVTGAPRARAKKPARRPRGAR